MNCDCTLCKIRAGIQVPKPDGCKCPGPNHTSMFCFVTRPVKT